MNLTVLQKNYRRTGVYGLWLLYSAIRNENGKLIVFLFNSDLQLHHTENLGAIRPNEGNLDSVITKRLNKREFYFDSLFSTTPI